MELLEDLEKSNAKMVKIIITGFPNMAPKTSAHAYLVKPVKPEELISLIKEKLNRT
jgi:DNA-binding NtrC family response regulator